MEVNAVSTQTEGIVPNGKAVRTKPNFRHRVRVNPANDEIPEGDKTKGVIRNLLDGHYKGVADVRLRIVHFEELAQIENDNLKEAAGDNVSKLLGSVDSAVNDLLDSIPPTEESLESEDAQDTAAIVTELHQEFIASVNQLLQDFVSSDNPSTNSLITGIESLFEAFITSLRDLLIPPTEEPLTETEQIETEQEPPAPETETTATENPAEGGSETPAPAVPDYSAFIDAITAAFTEAITDLTQALNGLTILPELTEATGNGAAYDKFLTIYNQMLGIETIQENITTGEELDTIA